MKSKLSGVVPPLITPFDENGQVDHESLKNVCNHVIEGGVHGLFMLGSTAGTVFLTNQQRIEVVKTIVEANNGRVPLLLGEINMQANRCIEQIQSTFDALGEDSKYISGLVCAAPFYAICDEQNVELHFRMIHDAFPDLELFAYDIPVCTNYKFPVEMLIKLGKEGVISGVKDSSGDDVSFRLLTLRNNEEGHPLQLFTGHEVVVDGSLLDGADGVVPGLANVEPTVYVDMYKAAKSNKWEEVKRLQDYAAKLMYIVFCGKSVSGFSAGAGSFNTALKLMGIIKSDTLPKPAITLNDDDRQKISELLKEAKIL